MEVILLERTTQWSAWEPIGYGKVLGKSKNYYVIQDEFVDKKRLCPRDALYYCCEEVKVIK